MIFFVTQKCQNLCESFYICFNLEDFQIGLGTWFQDKNGETENEELITNSLISGIDEVGYRLLDTANNYKSTMTFLNIVPDLIRKHSSEKFCIIGTISIPFFIFLY